MYTMMNIHKEAPQDMQIINVGEQIDELLKKKNTVKEHIRKLIKVAGQIIDKLGLM